jgi:D-amino-acid dehydrogenase
MLTVEPLPAGSTVAVVGAGIIGASAAFALAERGFRVTLIDRDEPARSGPSFGNAGHVAGQGIFPLASPGIGVRGMRMLMDKEGPLKIPPGYARQMVPWLWHFWRTSYGEAQEQAIAGLTQLARDTLEETAALWTRAGMAQLLRRQPALSLYDSEASYQLDLDGWQRAAREGFGYAALSASEVRELEPALAPIFPRGVLSHDYGYVTDPFEVATAMFKAALARGADYEQAAVTAIGGGETGASAMIAGAERRFDALLVAAGVWSKPLAASFGDKLPVEAERGYNLTYTGQQELIRHPLLLADRGIAVTPLAIGLRFGGWTELGGIRLPPNPGRWTAIRAIADHVLPGLRGAQASEWMGHRPSVPDSVPVLSRSRRSARVFYGVGHGHYGLSYSAKSARFLTELIADGADAQFEAFSIARFS